MKKSLLIAALLLSCLAVFAAGKVYVSSMLVSNSLLKIHFADGSVKNLLISPALAAGEERTLEYKISNDFFDKTRLHIKVKGENGEVPELLINEFITKGNKNNKDKVELFALSDGNLKGVCIRYGKSVLKLRSRKVRAGDIVYYELPDGLAQNNGYIEIRSTDNESARVLDRVVYTSSDGGEYSENWSGEGVNVSQSTATRSVCRKLSHYGIPVDTDGAEDFYTTVTRGASWGEANNTEVYE